MAATTSRSSRVAVAAVVIAGCPTPAQEGGLAHIDTQGFARRLELVCSSGHPDPSCPPAPDASSGEDPDGGAGDGIAPDAGAELAPPTRP